MKRLSLTWKWVQDNDVLIDAILGTGLEQQVRGLYRNMTMNTLSIPILAVDLQVWTHWENTRAVLARHGHVGFPVGQVIDRGSICGRLSVDISIPGWWPNPGIKRWWLDSNLPAAGWPAIPPPQGRATYRSSPDQQEDRGSSPHLPEQVGRGRLMPCSYHFSNPVMEVKLTEV
jgi:NAD(P)H-hydrate epimerase